MNLVNDDLLDAVKPCPFCGGMVTMKTLVIYPNGERSPAYIRCRTCNLSFAGYENEDVVNRWNTRPIEDALHAELVLTGEKIAELRNNITAYRRTVISQKEIIAKLKEDAEKLLAIHVAEPDRAADERAPAGL
jgi:hypothetical protein